MHGMGYGKGMVWYCDAQYGYGMVCHGKGMAWHVMVWVWYCMTW